MCHFFAWASQPEGAFRDLFPSVPAATGAWDTEYRSTDHCSTFWLFSGGRGAEWPPIDLWGCPAPPGRVSYNHICWGTPPTSNMISPCQGRPCLGPVSPASTLPWMECPLHPAVCVEDTQWALPSRLNSSGSLFIHVSFLQMLSWQKPFIPLTRHIEFTNGFDSEHICSNCPPLVRHVAIALDCYSWQYYGLGFFLLFFWFFFSGLKIKS